MHLTRRILTAVLVFTVVAAAVVAQANDEDSGRLKLLQVIEDGKDGVEGLFGARSAALSPDGAQVYVASQFGGTLDVFTRDPATGRLTLLETHRNGVDGIDGLSDAREVVVSPEGAHIYVASGADTALVAFARDASTGRLTFVEVQRDSLPPAGSTDYGPVGLAVSPDGTHIYAAGVLPNDVAVFSRDPATGMLTAVEVVPIGLPANSGGFVYRETGGVVVSPDGAQVYAVGRHDDALTAFQRDTQTGRLTRIGSWQEGVEGVEGIFGAYAPTLSPDGANVYVAGAAGHSVAIFARNLASGELSFVDAVREGLGGIQALTGPRVVQVSPDGSHAYVTALTGKSILLFDRDPQTGSLSFIETRRDVVPGWLGMGQLLGFAISPDGRHLYLPSRSYNALLVFGTDEGGMAPIVRCVGDCNYSCDVTVDELVKGVNIAMGTSALNLCEMFDRDGSRKVTVDELVSGVNGALNGCSDPLTPGDHRRTLAFGGERRIYDVHIPPSYDGAAPLPLLLEFHGFHVDPAQQRGLSGFKVVSDEEGFILVSPLGLFGQEDVPEAATSQGPGWNAGWCCGGAAFSGTDDVGFVRAVVQAVAAEANVDLRRVYATGNSNGATITQRLACEAADAFAAVAPVAGRIFLVPVDLCQPSRPIAHIEFAGLKDSQANYDGTALYQSAPESLAWWRDTDGCTGATPDERVDLGTSFCETYNQCDAGAQVELCSVNVPQNIVWPGHATYLNPDIDIARTAWQFLSQFSLAQAQ